MKKVADALISVFKTVAIPLVFFFVLLIVFPTNVHGGTLLNIMYQAIAPAVLALGMLFNIKVNNWDFSVGAGAMVSAIIGGQLAVNLNLGFFGMLVFCALIGLGCGLINGLIYKCLKIPTIIITIGMCLILESIAALAFGGSGVMVPQGYIVLNSFVPQIVFGVVCLAIAFALYNFLPIGYHIRAIGSSVNIASRKGIDAAKVKIAALAFAGLFAGFYAAITLGTAGVYRPANNSMGTLNTCFDAMMCVFVGMCIEKSTNLVISVYIGAVVLKFLKLTLMLFGTQSAYDQIFTAVFVLVFLCYSTRADKKLQEKIYKFRSLSNIAG